MADLEKLRTATVAIRPDVVTLNRIPIRVQAKDEDSGAGISGNDVSTPGPSDDIIVGLDDGHTYHVGSGLKTTGIGSDQVYEYPVLARDLGWIIWIFALIDTTTGEANAGQLVA